MDWRYEQIVKRFAEQKIDTSGLSILIDDNVFNGESIEGACLSFDGKFICIPVIEESINSEEFCYRPQCFEIVAEYETFCSNGTMAFRTHIRLLRA